MGMMHHYRHSSSMGMMGIILAIIGLIVFAVLVYELMMNKAGIAEHMQCKRS